MVLLGDIRGADTIIASGTERPAQWLQFVGMQVEIHGGDMRNASTRFRLASSVGAFAVVLFLAPLSLGPNAQAATNWNCGFQNFHGPTFVKAKGVSCDTAWDFVQRATLKWESKGFRKNTFGYVCEATADSHGTFRATCSRGGAVIKWGVAA